MSEEEYISEKTKQVIGLYGEMQLAMALHQRGWQVHRAYIDDCIDFIITKYFCNKCNQFAKQFIRKEKYTDKKGKEKIGKCVTNLCENCKVNELSIITKYLQVKTSEGIKNKKHDDRRDFSFHAKIRYHMEYVYYIWIAVFIENTGSQNKSNIAITHYYIFKPEDIKFNDLSIDSYQVTDNQKTALCINTDGTILNEGKKYSYECFKSFHNNFKILDDF